MEQLDDKLREYATDRQWELYSAYVERGGFSAAAEALDVHRTTIRDAVRAVLRKAAKQGYAPAYDLTHEVPDGLTLKGTSIRYDGDGQVQQYWNKTKQQGREQQETTQLPDPKKITKVSKLYDAGGRVIQEWVSEKPELVAREAVWRQFAQELARPLPRVEPTPAPNAPFDRLMACYPVGDHHLGMLAWKHETGDSYDIEIAEKYLMQAIDWLVATVPPCSQSLVAFLGDFMHYDSFDTVTPTSRNLLDADGRFPKMVRAAVRTMRYVIDAALRRHGRVHVIVEIGNHDLSSSVFLMECLRAVYEKEPRVTIDTSPRHFHYFEWGQNLVGTHHGHGPKMNVLPMIMAHDKPEAWGRTKHRYWWTGHIHNQKQMDVAGCSVESFRVLGPTDAWAANKGYRAIRDMKAIVLNKDHGEVSRSTVNTSMFKGAA